jgi:hypothetical protein
MSHWDQFQSQNNMKTYFYSHIVKIDSLTSALDTLELTKDEKAHLLALAQSNIHHAVLDAILSELSAEDKVQVLKHVASDKHGEVWDLLNTKIEKIEDKIKAAAESLTKELHEDITQTKKNS